MDWIEINKERSNLPEICSEVLVTYKHGEITTELSLFAEDGIFYDIKGMDNWDNRVIAWMYDVSKIMKNKITDFRLYIYDRHVTEGVYISELLKWFCLLFYYC